MTGFYFSAYLAFFLKFRSFFSRESGSAEDVSSEEWKETKVVLMEQKSYQVFFFFFFFFFLFCVLFECFCLCALAVSKVRWFEKACHFFFLFVSLLPPFAFSERYDCHLG